MEKFTSLQNQHHIAGVFEQPVIKGLSVARNRILAHFNIFILSLIYQPWWLGCIAHSCIRRHYLGSSTFYVLGDPRFVYVAVIVMVRFVEADLSVHNIPAEFDQLWNFCHTQLLLQNLVAPMSVHLAQLTDYFTILRCCHLECRQQNLKLLLHAKKHQTCCQDARFVLLQAGINRDRFTQIIHNSHKIIKESYGFR